MTHKLAIDFGTTNSVVARWDEAAGGAQLLAIPGLSMRPEAGRQPLVPSLLYVHDGRTGRVTIGQAVLDQGLDRGRGSRLFRSFKRGITRGRTAGPNLESRFVDGVPWSDRDAGQHFLGALIEAVPVAADEIEQLVITVPVAAYEGYAAWLGEALPRELAGCIRIVDESTAAALGYAVTEPQAVVMVLDLGGGTLDLSLVQLPESREKTGRLLGHLLGRHSSQTAARVIAKAGVSLGGSDIDQWLLAEVLARAHLSTADLGEAHVSLLPACEEAKIALSSVETTAIEFETTGGQSHTLAFRRQDLEALLEARGFYRALHDAVERVMGAGRRVGIYREDVHHVLLVGGLALMPSVQRTVSSIFRDQAVRLEKPFTAVVEGALQLASGCGLEDHVAHSYGLRYLDPESGQHHYDEVIPMGSRYPTTKPVRVRLAAAHPGQQAIEFIIGQIDAGAVSMVEVEYQDGMASFVAQADARSQQMVPLNPQAAATLVPLSPPGTPGEDRLQAEFAVDAQRHLRLSVADLKTGRQLLRDIVVVTLGAGQEPEAASPPAGQGTITGREPCLTTYTQPGRHRLSLRGLATMLDLLPAESISLAAVAEALRSPDPTVRWTAAEMLSKRGDRDARRIMQAALADGTGPQRASVARHLHRMSWFAAEPFLRQALADDDQRVRESAVFSLCKMRSREAYGLLEEVLPGETDAVRLEAAWGLNDSRDPRAVPTLQIALQARDPKVRAMALESLGATEAPAAIAVVRQAIKDPDLDVRYAAVLSLIELAEEDCFAEVAALIHAAHGPPREQVLRAFFHAINYLQLNVATSAAVEDLLQALEVALADDQPGARVAAAMPLITMGHERATAILRQGYYREPDPEAKARMMSVAVLLSSPAGDEFLQDGLQSAERHVRETAEDLAEYLTHSGGET